MRIALLTLLLLCCGPSFAASPQECLTEAIYFEAGTKGSKGRAAVGHTILNRVESADFPNSICEVITQGEADETCQFSYRCDGLPETVRYPSKFRNAKTTAKGIISGHVKDPTNGALFFHSARIPPGWFATRKRLGEFGGNIFYK